MLAAVIEGPGATVRRVALAPMITGRFPRGEVARARARRERPEHLKLVLDVAGR